MHTLAKFIASFGGSGYLPKAPGTWGSLVATALYGGLGQVMGSHPYFTVFLLLLIALFYFSGYWAIQKLSPEWGSDPSKVVIDEAIGVFVTVLPFGFSWTNAILGFILFRIFDIWKPLGIRKIDQWDSHSSHTVILDDIAAGIYAAVVLGFFNLWI